MTTLLQKSRQAKMDKVVFHGITTVAEGPTYIRISAGGSMGSRVENTVDPALMKLGYLKVALLKKKYPNHQEEGSPDYYYYLVLDKRSDVGLSDEELQNKVILEKNLNEAHRLEREIDSKENELSSLRIRYNSLMAAITKIVYTDED